MHSLTEMGFSEVNPGIHEPVRDWLDRIETDWSGPGLMGRSRNWFESEYCPSSEIPGQEKRPPNKYRCFIFSNIYINIGFYVHRNIVENES